MTFNIDLKTVFAQNEMVALVIVGAIFFTLLYRQLRPIEKPQTVTNEANLRDEIEPQVADIMVKLMSLKTRLESADKRQAPILRKKVASAEAGIITISKIWYIDMRKAEDELKNGKTLTLTLSTIKQRFSEAIASTNNNFIQ